MTKSAVQNSPLKLKLVLVVVARQLTSILECGFELPALDSIWSGRQLLPLSCRRRKSGMDGVLKSSRNKLDRR